MNEDIERYCELLHNAYEKAAVGSGWETNPASRKPWALVPEANKATMRAAVAALVPVVQLEERLRAEVRLVALRDEARMNADNALESGEVGDSSYHQILAAAYRNAAKVAGGSHDR